MKSLKTYHLSVLNMQHPFSSKTDVNQTNINSKFCVYIFIFVTQNACDKNEAKNTTNKVSASFHFSSSYLPFQAQKQRTKINTHTKKKVKTGKAKLEGPLKVTPIVADNPYVLSYQIQTTPSVLETKTCTKNCILGFRIEPKLPCAYSKKTKTMKVKLKFEVEYKNSLGTIISFPPPPPLSLEISEHYTDDELKGLKQSDYTEYNRYTKCLNIDPETQDETDSEPPLPACGTDDATQALETSNEVSNLNTKNVSNANDKSQTLVQAQGSIECVPDNIANNPDDDVELLEETIDANENDDDPKWHQNFWQLNWTWQYAAIGGATVCMSFYLLKTLGLFGGTSAILEMLEEIPILVDGEEINNQKGDNLNDNY